tara:strand:- start:1140 stop:1382 length:243 start_codon:yes stop_codon:yes gene_type:complete
MTLEIDNKLMRSLLEAVYMAHDSEGFAEDSDYEILAKELSHQMSWGDMRTAFISKKLETLVRKSIVAKTEQIKTKNQENK